MIQLIARVDGKHCLILTGNTIEEAGKSCSDRFGARFQGFAPIPAEIRARSKWGEYRAGEVSRAEMEEWLAEQGDESEIRELFNQMRAG